MRPPPAYITANPYIPTSPLRLFSASPPRSPRSPTRQHYLTSPTSPYAFSSSSSPFSSIVHTPLAITDPRRYVQPPVSYRKTYFDSLIRPLSPARTARYGLSAGSAALGYLGLDLPAYSYEESLYRWDMDRESIRDSNYIQFAFHLAPGTYIYVEKNLEIRPLRAHHDPLVIISS